MLECTNVEMVSGGKFCEMCLVGCEGYYGGQSWNHDLGSCLMDYHV
jgi:hypothetical protein